MPAVPSWETQFDLTSPGGNLSFNVDLSPGFYFLDPANCSFNIGVRSTKSNVPQADGSILHTRFLTGVEMNLAIQLWESRDMLACADGELLAVMLDDLSRSLRSLLNAGDNEGRLAWEVAGQNERMLDDARLLVYSAYSAVLPQTVTATLDSQFPYAQDLTQIRTPCADGVPTVVTNTGSADYYPVFLVNMLNGVVGGSPVSSFTITTDRPSPDGLQIVYDDALPGATPIPGSHYGEINTFVNTFFEDGDGADLLAGVVEDESEFFPLLIGENTITITGADMDILWAPAWG